MVKSSPKGLMPGAPPKVRALANKGQSGDNMIAHLSGGEHIIPPEVLMANPELAQLIHNAFTKIGADPMKFIAGSPAQQINPHTGMPMFGFFSSIGHFFNNFVEPLAVDAAGFAVGGPWGAAAAGGLNSALRGGSIAQDVMGAAGGYFGGGTLLNGAQAIGNSAIDAFGGVGTYGAGQTIGSELSGLGTSISNGISNIGSDISGAASKFTNLFSGAGNTIDPTINAGQLATQAGNDYGTYAASGASGNALNSAPSMIAPTANVTGAASAIDPNSIEALTTPGAGLGTGGAPSAGVAAGLNASTAGAGVGTGTDIITGAGKMATDPNLLAGAGGASNYAPMASLASGGLQYLGTQNAIAANQKAQAQIQANEAPYMQTGNAANSQQANLVENPAAQQAFIKDNPFYKSLSTQATNTLLANQAAQGKAGSGGTAAALQDQLLQLGTGLVNNQVNNLGAIANRGQTAASGANSASVYPAVQGADLRAQAGQNLGAGAMGYGNAMTGNYNNSIATQLALARLNKLPQYSTQGQGTVY